MRVVVSEPARRLIAERGGRLYVRTNRSRCCGGGVTRLVTSSEPSAGVEFRRAVEADGFELFLPARLARLPDELHVEVRRRSRVEAFWNGCAWVV